MILATIVIITALFVPSEADTCGKAAIEPSPKAAKVTIEWYPMRNPLDRDVFYYVPMFYTNTITPPPISTPPITPPPITPPPISTPPNVTQ